MTGERQNTGASADAETGSRPTDQAASRLDGPRFDPARRSVASRLGGLKIVCSCTAETCILMLSGTLETQDQLDALVTALALMRDWLPDASGTLTEGGDVKQAPGDSLSGPTRSEARETPK